MDTFVQRYQPDRYENFINGVDYVEHYRDAAPKPSIEDFLLNRNNEVTDSMIRILIDRPKRNASALTVNYDGVRSACLLYAYGNYKEAAKCIKQYLENRKDSQAPLLYYLLAECQRHSTTKKPTMRTSENYRTTINLLLTEREENVIGRDSKNEQQENLMKRKQYTCNICGYTSYQSSSIVDHMDVHEKLYDRKCKICDKPFDKRKLRQHIMYYINSEHPSNGPHSTISKDDHKKYHAEIIRKDS